VVERRVGRFMQVNWALPMAVWNDVPWSVLPPRPSKMDAGKNDSRNYDMKIKVLIQGSCNVGKTSLTFRHAENKFSETTGIPQVGIDYKILTLVRCGKAVKVEVWDNPFPRFRKRSLRSKIRTINAIMVVYDVTDLQSFDFAVRQCQEIIDLMDDDCADLVAEGVPVLLVANKVDLLNDRTSKEPTGYLWAAKKAQEEHRTARAAKIKLKGELLQAGRNAANDMKCAFFATCAKTGEGVMEAFDLLECMAAQRWCTQNALNSAHSKLWQ